MSACIACDICGEHQGGYTTFRFNVMRPIKGGIRRSEGDACRQCAERLAKIIDSGPNPQATDRQVNDAQGGTQ